MNGGEVAVFTQQGAIWTRAASKVIFLQNKGFCRGNIRAVITNRDRQRDAVSVAIGVRCHHREINQLAIAVGIMVNRRFQLKGVAAIWAQGQDEHFTVRTGSGVRRHAVSIDRFRERHRFTLRGHAVNRVGGQVKLVAHNLIRPLNGGEVAVFA